MTGLVRGLLAAPVAVLVGWLGAHGIGADPDLVGAVLGAVVAGLLGAGMHAAEDRWPWLRRAVAWLARESRRFVPDSPGRDPLRGSVTDSMASGHEQIRRVDTPTSPAGPSNVRRVPPDGPSTGTS